MKKCIKREQTIYHECFDCIHINYTSANVFEVSYVTKSNLRSSFARNAVSHVQKGPCF